MALFSFTGFWISFRTMACRQAAEPTLNIVYDSIPTYVEYFQSQYAEHGRFFLLYSGFGKMARMILCIIRRNCFWYILNIVYASSPSYVEYFQSQYAEHGRFVLLYSGLGKMARMNVAYP